MSWSDVVCLFFSRQIVQRYDIVLIQEVRDISETAIEDLIDACNEEIGYTPLFYPHPKCYG